LWFKDTTHAPVCCRAGSDTPAAGDADSPVPDNDSQVQYAG
jgi:hypothetical protein